jgi:hypothetical protein
MQRWRLLISFLIFSLVCLPQTNPRAAGLDASDSN